MCRTAKGQQHKPSDRGESFGRPRGDRGELLITEDHPPPMHVIRRYRSKVLSPHVGLEWVTEPARIGVPTNAFVVNRDWSGWHDGGFWVGWTLNETAPNAWSFTDPWPVDPSYLVRYLEPDTT